MNLFLNQITTYFRDINMTKLIFWSGICHRIVR